MQLLQCLALALLCSVIVAEVKCPTNVTACECEQESDDKIHLTCDGENRNFTQDIMTLTRLKISIDKLSLARLVNTELPVGVVDLVVNDLAISASPNLKKIDGIVDFENLRSITLLDVGLERVPLKIWSLTTLQYILIDKTDITSIRAGAFGNLLISKMHVQNNAKLTTLEEDAFAALMSMTELGLGNNALKALSPRSFPPGKTLKSIDLKGNELTSIPKGLFTRVAGLTSLDISSNKLTTIDASLENFLMTDGYLKIQDNDIECTCLMKWLGRTSEQKQAKRYHVLGTCGETSYVPMKLVPLYMLTPEMFENC